MSIDNKACLKAIAWIIDQRKIGKEFRDDYGLEQVLEVYEAAKASDQPVELPKDGQEWQQPWYDYWAVTETSGSNKTDWKNAFHAGFKAAMATKREIVDDVQLWKQHLSDYDTGISHFQFREILKSAGVLCKSDEDTGEA